ncbi:DUF1543 domain-containing protein [Hyphomonas sp.]|uniref:DUF1543 domain-containing protein n=1 Tax=Hyphomonas sp. TaxID=87 RepID=UPI0033420AB9
MKLFAVFVGGNHPRSNIEVHDLRFVTGETILDTIPQLRAAWWGKPSSLHIDGYAELAHADGRRIDVIPGPAPANPEASLWFVNVGGYTPELFGEQHHYLFMVGADKTEVWARARKLSPDWSARHKDNLASVDDVMEVNAMLGDEGFHIRVCERVPGAHGPRIVSDYLPL